jgi:beta-lactamase superfamily II metal-dependent hydrolase
MPRRITLFFALVIFVTAVVVGAQSKKELEIYSIDVEGGNSVLFVSPSGQSLLFDAGNPGARDADQIANAAKKAGLKQIDYLVISHFHGDHFGSVPELATRIPIITFVDHGPKMIETREASVNAYNAYAAVRDKAHYMPVKAGDKVPIKGLDVEVVTSDGVGIAKPLPGAGAPNPLCKDAKPLVENEPGSPGAEDGRSVGIVVRYGKFRVVEFGDLTFGKENALVCPNNLIGKVDLYFTDRHGLAAGSPEFVHALAPRVAIFDNSARKGIMRDSFMTVKSSPGIEDIWQLHYSVPRQANPNLGETGDQGGKDANTADENIANLAEQHTAADPAHNLQISAHQNGSFAITNERTGYSKEYKAH